MEKIELIVEGGETLMAYPLQYYPEETSGMGGGVGHLPILESIGPTVEGEDKEYVNTEDPGPEVKW